MKWVLITTGLTFVIMWVTEGIRTATIIAFIIFFMSLYIYSRIRKCRIIVCTNCKFRMTLGQFERNGGCIRCGTDLYEETGRYPRWF
jgi:hypothetical protein